MYTVKELADLLKVSKPTVQKVINENLIEADKLEKNKYRYYSDEKAAFIIRVIKPDFDFSILPQNTEKSLKNTEKPQSISQEFAENIAKPQSEESLNRMLSIIEQQLAEKNKQLAQKDKEIQDLREQAERERIDLQDKLAAAYAQISEMAQKAQYITAADKTVQIIDKQKKDDIVSAEEIDNEEKAAGPREEETPAAPIGTPEEQETIRPDSPKKEGILSKLLSWLGR